MTAVDVDALAKLREAATAGPWFAWNRGVGWHIAVEDPQGVDHLPGRPELLPEGMRTDLARAEDAALIVAAVNALEPLTSVARAALATRDALRNWGDDLTEAQVRALRRALDKACEVLDR